MMENDHPDQLELLTHVDKPPRSDRAREVAAHVAECETCAAVVGRLQAAKTALRSAPRLELPSARRRAISSALGEHPRPRRSPLSPLRPPSLLAPLVVAVVVVASVVVALDAVREGGGDGRDAAPAAETQMTDERAGGGGAAPEKAAPEAAAPEAADTGAAQASALSAPVRSVAGPAAEVLRRLRAEELTARTSGGRVVVSDATPDQVLDALRGRRAGRVSVVLE